MAETPPNRPRRRKSSAQETAPAPAAAPKPAQRPFIEPETVHAILNWLNTVDDWSIAGHRNSLPRWVYVLLALFILT